MLQLLPLLLLYLGFAFIYRRKLIPCREKQRRECMFVHVDCLTEEEFYGQSQTKEELYGQSINPPIIPF